MIKTSVTGAQQSQAAIKAELARITSGASNVLIGFPEGSGSYDTGEAVSQVAAFQEFGTETIPARPFLVPGVESGNAEYLAIAEEGLTAVVDGEMSSNQVMAQIGVMAEAKVKEFIINLSSPPNASSTIRSKKSSNPLIDTGSMVQSVTHVVADEKPTEGI